MLPAAHLIHLFEQNSATLTAEWRGPRFTAAYNSSGECGRLDMATGAPQRRR